MVSGSEAILVLPESEMARGLPYNLQAKNWHKENFAWMYPS
jgi:hypothetical protein